MISKTDLQNDFENEFLTNLSNELNSDFKQYFEKMRSNSIIQHGFETETHA